MKKIFATAYFCLGLLFVVQAYTGSAAKDSVLLKGMVYNNKDRVKGVIVNIYIDNELFKKVKVRSSNRFTTNLPINENLTIEITAEEFYPKRFLFDTSVPEELSRIPDYEFDIDIFKREELEGVNTSFLDFPVGLVSYDNKKEIFIRNKKYTKEMKKAYLLLWNEAQEASERSGFDNEEEK